MAENIRGYLVIKVIEASGKNKDDNYVWDAASFEGFVKVELRGGSRNVKQASKKANVAGTGMLWNEELRLEVLDNANELRVMLCKEKIVPAPGGVKRGTTVLAACGIYVSDILDAVPIDKYFELFKPAGGGEGGFIRLELDFKKDPSQLPAKQGASSVAANGTPTSSQAAASRASKSKKRRHLWAIPLSLLLAAAMGAAGIIGKRIMDERRRK